MWLMTSSSQFAYVMLKKVCHRKCSLLFMSVFKVLQVKQFQKISSQTLLSGSYSHTYFVERLMMVLEECLDY